MKPDIIFLYGLNIDTVIGVYDWERKIRQTVIIDLELRTDVRKAALTDCIEDALDYKAVAKRLTKFISDSSFNLVETLAEHCIALLVTEFKLQWVRIKINKKGAVSGVEDVGVIIERERFGVLNAENLDQSWQ
jgi:dihydroneopterin aldolase